MLRSPVLINATTRLALSVIVGSLTGVLAAFGFSMAHGALIGIASTATVFVVTGLLVMWPMSAETTRREARHEVFRPLVDEMVVTAAALCGLGGTVALLLMGGADADVLPALVALLSVFMSWAGLHLMYAARYAYMYYGDAGGVDFQIETAPSYREFFYFSYTIGISSNIPGGVSVSHPALMAVILRHGILSYVFRALILAATVNVVVGVFTA